MKISKSGFTIVELLIVIVVIGILAAITIVAYNGIQLRSKNSARASEVASASKLLELYKASKGDYPGVASVVSSGVDKKFCIGTNFPGNVCDSSSVSSTDTTFTDKLATLGNVPSSHSRTTNGNAGPVVTVWGGGWGFTLQMWMQGSQTSDCPSQIPNLWWDDPNSDALLCGINYNFMTQLGA